MEDFLGMFMSIFMLLFTWAIISACSQKSLEQIDAEVVQPGIQLCKKFISLGNVKGKTLEEIEEVVGPPNSWAFVSRDTKLLQWMATGYHICLIFSLDDICQGIISESRQFN
jgi:hypothetical protein